MKKFSIIAVMVFAAAFGARADVMPCDVEMENPIVIHTFDELLKIGNDPCYTEFWHYELGNDIDASPSRNMNDGRGFEPILGKNDVQSEPFLPFMGTFDGKGYVIRGLYINRPYESCVGLFCAVSSGGVVKNLGVEVDTVIGYNNVGGLAGINNGGTITRSYVRGVRMDDFEIPFPWSRGLLPKGYVSGNSSVGGLVGRNADFDDDMRFFRTAVIDESYASMDVYGTENRVGGLAGENSGQIVNSYSISNVSGNKYVGGLVGFNGYGHYHTTAQPSDGRHYTITNCYSAGTVTGVPGSCREYDGVLVCGPTPAENVGPFVGHNMIQTGQIVNSYYDRDQTILDWIDIAPDSWGVVGKTKRDMMDARTYVGWDFESIWRAFPIDYCWGGGPLCEGAYPHFPYQSDPHINTSIRDNSTVNTRANSAMPQVSVRGRVLNVSMTQTTQATSNIMQIRMIDMRGRVVMSRSVDAVETRHALSLQKIPAGRYVVEIRNANRRVGTSPIIVR